jgi:hypothetical protein
MVGNFWWKERKGALDYFLLYGTHAAKKDY